MGGSSTPSNTTSKTTQELPSWIKPYSTQLLARGVSASKRPYVPYGGQRVAGRTGGELRGLDYISRIARGGEPLSADQSLALGGYRDTVGGGNT